MSNIVNDTTCFDTHKSKNKSCNVKTCRHWHNLEESNNCILNKVSDNLEKNVDMTLQEIGDIFNITRMRICQIEKNSLKKLKKVLPN